jgi:hypothetical protein
MQGNALSPLFLNFALEYAIRNIQENQVRLKLNPVNANKTKYVLLSRHQNAGQNHNIKIANSSYENVAQFRYMGMTAPNQNLIQEEIKRRVNSDNASYHSVQNLFVCPSAV